MLAGLFFLPKPEPAPNIPLIIVGIIIGIAIFVVTIYIDQYIYKDAVDKGLNAEIWLLIVLFTPIMGWIVYFIVRKYRKGP